MVVMYILSFALLGAQWELADTHGYVLTNFDGVELKSAIHEYVQQERLNQYTDSIISADYQGNSTAYDKIETSITAGVFVVWELITLMSGTHIFSVLILFGIPPIFVAIFVVTYVFLLARAIIGYIRPGL
jgi:hypothetical protein